MFKARESLNEQEIEKGLKAVINDGLASQAMVTFTSGAFLVAFALKLGASNVIIGLLAAIPPLMQLIQLPSIYLVEKLRNRRAITVYSSLISRTLFMLIAVTPFLFSNEIALSIVIITMILQSAFGAISNTSWGSWMRDLIPEQRLGTFFSQRMRLSMAITIILSLSIAYYLDFWKVRFPEYELYSYSPLFLFGFLSGIIGVYYLSITPEPSLKPLKKKEGLFQMISQPFKDINFKNLLVFSGAWSFAVSLAAPFFTVYMLNRLGLGLSFIIALTVLSQIMNFIFLRVWGKFSDRFSNKSVLAVSGPLFIFSILAWTFTTLPDRYFLTIPLLIIIHIVMGISLAGVNLASGNIGFKLAPKGQATSYLAARNIINAIAAGIAPVLGGIFADFFAKRELSWTLTWRSPGSELILPTLNLQQWDFFFFFAFLIGIYSLHRLTAINEVGEVEEKIVFQELFAEVRREVRTLSTLGGIRQLVTFPVTILRYRRKSKFKK
jgi:MFS family permease